MNEADGIKAGLIVLITGPSGAGKTSFINGMMDRDERLAFSVSTTTRPMRRTEQQGREYDFVDNEGFDLLLAEDAFVEWAQVHNNRYGTRRSYLDDMVEKGKIPVLDIDVQGGINVLGQFGSELLSVFLFPPSWEELERRLTDRGTDSPDVISTRLKNARREVRFAGRYDYWIVNDDLEASIGRMMAVLQAHTCRREYLGRAPLV